MWFGTKCRTSPGAPEHTQLSLQKWLSTVLKCYHMTTHFGITNCSPSLHPSRTFAPSSFGRESLGWGVYSKTAHILRRSRPRGPPFINRVCLTIAPQVQSMRPRYQRSVLFLGRTFGHAGPQNPWHCSCALLTLSHRGSRLRCGKPSTLSTFQLNIKTSSDRSCGSASLWGSTKRNGSRMMCGAQLTVS